MNTIGPGGLNPLSAQFRARAIKVATSQAGTVKTKKELDTSKESTKGINKDQVSLSAQAEKFDALRETNEASMTGTTQQLKKQYAKDEEDADKINMFGGEKEVHEGRTTAHGGSSGEDTEERAEEISLETKLDIMAAMNRSPEEILKDVPEGYATAARKIVEGQMEKGKPTQALTQLKEIPETVPIEVKHAGYVDIMPIHDEDNKPISMEMETSVS